MSTAPKCDACGAELRPSDEICSVCSHPYPSLIDGTQAELVVRLAVHAKCAFFATVPPVLLVALSALPQSLINLNLIAVQLFVQYYFNGRTAAVRRNRSSRVPGIPRSLLKPHFNRDILTVSASYVIASAGYLLLAKQLIAAR